MRKIKRTVLWFVCALFGLTSCSERQEYRGMLSRAEAVMDDHPDSALTILDSLSTHETEFGKRFLRQYQLRRLQAQNKTFVPLTSDSLAKILVSYYDSHGNANERMLAHYLLGCTYRDMGEAPHAIDCYLDATTQADTTAKDCDFYTLSCVYSQMAEIYYKQLLLSETINALKKASTNAFRANKTNHGILYLDKIAGTYILQNKRDSAEILLNQIQQLYLKNNLIQMGLQSSLKLMYLYLNDSKRLTDTKYLIDEYELKSDKFDDNHELHGNRRIYYYYKGQFFDAINQLDSAEYYYRKIYYPNMPLTSYNSMYKGLLSIYSERHQADSITKYAKLYCEVNDSSIAKKDQDLTAQMAASYNYNRYQKEAMENESKVHITQLFLLTMLASIIIASIILWNRYKKVRNKKKKELDDLNTKYQNATREYNKNMYTLQLLDTAHKGVIATIQEELERTKNESEVYRLKLSEIDTEYENTMAKLIEENRKLTESIKALEREKGLPRYLKNTEMFMDTEIVKHLKKLELKPLSMITEDDWIKLNAEVVCHFPQLLNDLNCLSKITKQKTRVCLLVLLRIQDSCIANWLGIKASRISNIKSELNQELFYDNSARSLYNNLRQKYNIISSVK